MAEPIRPVDLTAAVSVPADAALIIDNGVNVLKATPSQIGDTARPYADQSQAEAGVSNATTMTPLRTKQAIDSQIIGKANAAAMGVPGSDNDLGDFDGDNVPDGSTAKEAIQALSDALDTTSGDAATKANATALGVAATDANMGTPVSSIYTPDGTAKDWLEEAGAAIEGRAKADDLNSTASNKGVGLTGYSYASAYPANTAGHRLKQEPTVKDASFGAAGDGATNDTTAIAAAAAVTDIFAPSGQYSITDASLLLSGRYRGPGLFKILGRTVPMGDIKDTLSIYSGASEAFTNPDEVRRYLEDRNVLPTAIVTVNVADGTYAMPNEFYCRSPGMNNVQFIGNTTTPANCKLQFDATGNKSAIKPDCSHVRMDGFRIEGVGAIGATRADWNADCYGAAAYAVGAGSRISFGGHMEFYNFYYAMLAELAGSIEATNAKTNRSGDCALHARHGGVIRAPGVQIVTAAHVQGGVSLGYGVYAENGGNIDCPRGSATDCQVAGIAAGKNSVVYGVFNSFQNIGWGALALSGGLITMDYDSVYNVNPFLARNNGGGAHCVDFGMIYMSGQNTGNRGGIFRNGYNPSDVQVSTALGVLVESNGQFIGNWLNITDNSGRGMYATGPNAQSRNGTLNFGGNGSPPLADNGGTLSYTQG